MEYTYSGVLNRKSLNNMGKSDFSSQSIFYFQKGMGSNVKPKINKRVINPESQKNPK